MAILATIGAGISSVVAPAASIAVQGAIGGALVGAAVGALTSAVTGGDILKGALVGAVTGGVGGYLANPVPDAVANDALVGSSTMPSGTYTKHTGDAGLKAAQGMKSTSVAPTVSQAPGGMTMTQMMAAQGVSGAAEGLISNMGATELAEAEEKKNQLLYTNKGVPTLDGAIPVKAGASTAVSPVQTFAADLKNLGSVASGVKVAAPSQGLILGGA